MRAEDFAIPAPVRYRSTAAVYDAGGVDMGTTRARGNRSAPPAPEFGHWFDCHARPTLPNLPQ
ncbi:hypothetical protein GCM10020254_88130 [Streptomyces goshikiensis]